MRQVQGMFPPWFAKMASKLWWGPWGRIYGLTLRGPQLAACQGFRLSGSAQQNSAPFDLSDLSWSFHSIWIVCQSFTTLYPPFSAINRMVGLPIGGQYPFYLTMLASRAPSQALGGVSQRLTSSISTSR